MTTYAVKFSAHKPRWAAEFVPQRISGVEVWAHILLLLIRLIDKAILGALNMETDVYKASRLLTSSHSSSHRNGN